MLREALLPAVPVRINEDVVVFDGDGDDGDALQGDRARGNSLHRWIAHRRRVSLVRFMGECIIAQPSYIPYQLERSFFELNNVLVVHASALREYEQRVILGVFDVGFQAMDDFTAVLRHCKYVIEERGAIQHHTGLHLSLSLALSPTFASSRENPIHCIDSKM